MIEKLLADMNREITKLFLMMRDGQITIDEWHDLMEKTLARYHIASWSAGGKDINSGKGMIRVALKQQFEFLQKFVDEIKNILSKTGEWLSSWLNRARMYAGSIKTTFWESKTYGLPLPAQPAQGTQCLTNCKCEWEIIDLDGNGNHDAYWRRHADDSCQTCIQRGADWSPLRIRAGRIL